MPSVDVVSTVDFQSLDNAVNNVKREVATRFDFRGVKSEIILDRKAKVIHIASGDEWKVKTVSDMLVGQCVRQKVEPKSLDFEKIDTISTTSARRKGSCPRRKQTAPSRSPRVQGTTKAPR